MGQVQRAGGVQMAKGPGIVVTLLYCVELVAGLAFVAVCVFAYRNQDPTLNDIALTLMVLSALFSFLIVVVVMELGKAIIETAENTARTVELLEELAEAQRKRTMG
jgi:uncharacterized membrane-anchored protein